MTSFVDVTSYEVNHSVQLPADARALSGNTEDVNLLDRINYVLGVRPKLVASGRAWSAKAGLGETYVGTLTTRLRAGDAGARSDELVRLAQAAGVSVAWFTAGLGAPHDVAGEPDKATLILLSAKDAGIPGAIIDEWFSGFGEDALTVPVDYALTEMRGLDRMRRGQPPVRARDSGRPMVTEVRKRVRLRKQR